MPEIKINIPPGWYIRPLIAAIVIISALLTWPYYQHYLNSFKAEELIERARAEVEAARILGECHGTSNIIR